MADLAKVKRNIQRMIDQNAPESDIDAYVASEGTSAEELRGQSQPTQSFNPRDFSMDAMGIDVDANKANYDRQQFESLPMWQKPLVAMDDMATIGGNALTLGALPWAAGHIRSKVNGTPYEQERAAIDDSIQSSRNRAGYAGVGMDLAGSVAGPVALAKKGVTATRALGQTGGLVADGAAIGGASAYFNDDDVMTGAGIGAGAGALGAGLGKVAGNYLDKRAMAKMQKAAPSFDKVSADKTAMYNTLENAGVKFDANSFAQTADDISATVAGFRQRAPYSSELADNLQAAKGASPGFRDIEDILSEAKGILREHSASQADKAAARQIVDKLSNYFDNAPLMTNGSLPANEVSALAKSAREMSRRHILARDVNEMQRKSEYYISNPESGMRNQAASYGKRAGRGLSPMEDAALKSVIKREGVSDIVTKAGGGLGQHFLGIGGLSVGGLPGLMAGYGTHFAARKIGERASRKSADKLMKTILAGRKAQANAKPSPKQLQYLNDMMRIGTSGGAVYAPGLFGSYIPNNQ